ncbi:MAG: outer membrane lipoprotein carrier protein LolA [Candidatus Binatia bacterium]
MASSIASEADGRRARRAALLLAAVLVTAGAWRSQAAGEAAPAPLAADLPALLAGMRSSSGVIAEFTETKELALLSSPLEATGTIYFVPPDRLVRVVTNPGRSRLVVSGDQVRFEDESGSKALDLSASPIARQLIDSFVVLFNGDEKKLKELYETDFGVDGSTWRLRLTPRSMPLTRMIASFELTGTGAHIDRMVAVEPDGDRAVTVFGKTDAHYRFSEAELAELFGEPPAS